MNVHIDDDLQTTDKTKNFDMLESYSDFLTDIPGLKKNSTKHVINVCQYSLPFHYEEEVKKELTQLLNVGII